MNIKSVIFLLMYTTLFSLVGCSSKEKYCEEAVYSFYDGNLNKFKTFLYRDSVLRLLIPCDSIKFKKRYILSSIKEKTQAEGSNRINFPYIRTINKKVRDTVEINLYCESYECKIFLDEKLLFDLLKYEDEECFKIGKILFDSSKYNESIKWFKCAIAYSVQSKYYLGLSYSYTDNYPDAIGMLELTYNQGYGKAAIRLSELYSLSGHRERAIELLKKEVPKGNTEAMVHLGDYYDVYSAPFGYAPPKDASEQSSFYWYKMAAEKGNVGGMIQLGSIHEFGKLGLVNEDSAYYWYHEGALRNEPLGMIKVGRFLIEGKGIQNNFSDGWNWLVKASKTNKIGKAMAYYEMGEIFELGIGTKKDINKALEYYKISASQAGWMAEQKVRDLSGSSL